MNFNLSDCENDLFIIFSPLTENYRLLNKNILWVGRQWNSNPFEFHHVSTDFILLNNGFETALPPNKHKCPSLFKIFFSPYE
jgi:hypothetical protein